MPIDFSSWVSRQANSIEDSSVIAAPEGKQYTRLSPLEIRMQLADLLVPYQDNDDEIEDWVTVFCVSLNFQSPGQKGLTEATLSSIIGTAESQKYYAAEDNKLWLNSLKDRIKRGVFVRDIGWDL